MSVATDRYSPILWHVFTASRACLLCERKKIRALATGNKESWV